MKILFITYNFPPEVIGIRRILKWIEHLYDFNISSVVLTVKPVFSPQYDNSPLERIKSLKIPIIRSGSLDPFRLKYIYEDMKEKFGSKRKNIQKKYNNRDSEKDIMSFLRKWIYLPDDRIGWLPFALFKGIAAIKKHKPDVIISTSYPNTAHLVGLLLKKFCNVPWIADFRDGWSQNPTFFSHATLIHNSISKWMEKIVVANADNIITVSPPITEFLKTICPKQSAKFHTIYNGYDPADFESDDRQDIKDINHSLTQIISDKKFTLTYTGTFYGKRSPVPFLKAVKDIIDRGLIPKDEMDVRFFTKLPKEFVEYIKENLLEETVKVSDFLPYKECLTAQKNSSVLLLFLPREKNTEIMVTQKVFEYLWSKRPILAIIPDGACKDLLKQTGGAIFADPDNCEEIKSSILNLYESWKKKDYSLVADETALSKFTRKNQTKQLIKIINDLIKE